MTEGKEKPGFCFDRYFHTAGVVRYFPGHRWRKWCSLVALFDSWHMLTVAGCFTALLIDPEPSSVVHCRPTAFTCGTTASTGTLELCQRRIDSSYSKRWACRMSECRDPVNHAQCTGLPRSTHINTSLATVRSSSSFIRHDHSQSRRPGVSVCSCQTSEHPMMSLLQPWLLFV